MVFLSICSRSQRYSVGFFCREILRLSTVLYSIVLSSMMLFKPSFGLTRSLFILYVHEHDCLGSGLYLIRLHLLILIVLIATEKVSRFRSNIIWNGWKSSLRALIRPGEILESVARSLIAMNEHAIANVCFDLSF